MVRPIQVVQAELIAIERGGDPVEAEDRRGADGLVTSLGVRDLVLGADARARMTAVLLLHELRDLAEGRVRDGHRVGPHVGDQTHRPLAGKVMPSYRRCASVIVFRAENPSFRAASCCSVEVVNGGAGDRLRSFRWTSTTR